MKLVVKMVVTVFVLALATGARATGSKAVAEIEAHDKAFLAAYEKGETKKMKSEIAKAVALGEKNGLGKDPVMADTYVLAAVLEVDGNDDAKAGVHDFVKALKIKPDVAIPKGMATSGVKAALKQARAELAGTPKEGAAVAAAAPPAEPPKAEAPAKPNDKPEKVAQPEPAKQEPAKPADKEDTQKADRAAAEAAAAAAKARDQQLAKDRADLDKQLADANARIQQLEKDKADRDKQLAGANARIQQLEKDKADRDKQLADARAQTQQLERDRADKAKELGDARAQESKDQEALQKITRDKQVADAQARDADNKKKQEQQERERLFAGPEMPTKLREALTCAVPDEAPLRADLFVHCVARPSLKARTLVFYYRAGEAHYYSVPMQRTTKGWYAAIVPGARVTGKSLQYYAQAFDGRESVVASNGKENSPNILMLRAGGPRG